MAARAVFFEGTAERALPGRQWPPPGGVTPQAAQGGLYFVPIQASSEARMASSTDISMGVVQLRGTNTV